MSNSLYRTLLYAYTCGIPPDAAVLRHEGGVWYTWKTTHSYCTLLFPSSCASNDRHFDDCVQTVLLHTIVSFYLILSKIPPCTVVKSLPASYYSWQTPSPQGRVPSPLSPLPVMPLQTRSPLTRCVTDCYQTLRRRGLKYLMTTPYSRPPWQVTSHATSVKSQSHQL